MTDLDTMHASFRKDVAAMFRAYKIARALCLLISPDPDLVVLDCPAAVDALDKDWRPEFMMQVAQAIGGSMSVDIITMPNGSTAAIDQHSAAARDTAADVAARIGGVVQHYNNLNSGRITPE